ncbi:glycosyltransferase family 4 protein [Blastococcus tunisiensis]|uniref:Glycosyltransferase involved in cell wall bisynthesis n=1 Tax=Blastococcus tunisiensis TaxID=1798228 RepID=A0A1I1WIE4_9ACTN|nr:glycosyltransferase family 1 protein [Blastococcus sp. DSM 46838]SFD94769.1 Glycosyltransferase involved in cell wall bisynthesis [Blastococcus sp. DSM 46838]
MRVAVVLEQCLAPVPGGTGRYSAEVAAALAGRPDLAVSGWVAWHRRPGAARPAGVDGPHRLPLPRRPLIAAWERGVGPAPGGRPDVVHAPTLLVPPRRGRPLVATIHDAVPWTHPETLTPRGVRWHRTMAERVARTADAVVVPTRAVADALREHVRPRRVEVIGEGGTAALLAPPPDAAARAQRLALPASGYLLSLATIEPRKGLDVLLAALADPAAPDLPLVVVGQPGWGGVDPDEVAAGLGLPAGRVRVMGRLSDTDLSVALAGATALVVPSRAEGFGLPVVEGMAAGVPVVTSADPALVEVGGAATRIAATGDAAELARVLRAVVDDPGERARMSAEGRRRASLFTWAAAAVELESLYRDLCGADRPG